MGFKKRKERNLGQIFLVQELDTVLFHPIIHSGSLLHTRLRGDLCNVKGKGELTSGIQESQCS